MVERNFVLYKFSHYLQNNNFLYNLGSLANEFPLFASELERVPDMVYINNMSDEEHYEIINKI